MAGRPPVDIVIPYGGSAAGLERLLASLAALQDGLGAADSVRVADNRPPGASALAAGTGRVEVVRVPGRRSSYHARNYAARLGRAPWILFVDADVVWEPGVLAAYFDPPPDEGVAILGGGIRDEPLPVRRSASAAERYAVQAETMAAENTLASDERMAYAQTANCLLRRAAFEAVGGFADGIRSGGDADLCWRVQAAGWRLEPRPAAAVTHRNRRGITALLGQKLRHGAGAAWLEQVHPGSFPARRLPGLALWSVRRVARAPAAERSVAVVDVAAVWAFELGRRLPNEARSGW